MPVCRYAGYRLEDVKSPGSHRFSVFRSGFCRFPGRQPDFSGLENRWEPGIILLENYFAAESAKRAVTLMSFPVDLWYLKADCGRRRRLLRGQRVWCGAVRDESGRTYSVSRAVLRRKRAYAFAPIGTKKININ